MPTTTASITNELQYANQGNLANTAFSFSLWFYIADWTANGSNPVYVFHVRGDASNLFGVFLAVRTTDGVFRFVKATTGSSATESSRFVETSGVGVQRQWYHVICSSDGTNGGTSMRIWVNGTLTTSAIPAPDQGADTINFNGNMYVCGRGTATLGLQGLVHKLVMVSGREFTEAERTELMAGRLPATVTNAYFRADYDANTSGISSTGATVTATVVNTVNMTARYPADMPGLAAWYNLNAASTVFEDTGATNAAEDEDAIAAITDRSGCSNTITQGTAANSPLWTTKTPGTVSRATMTEAGSANTAYLSGAGTSLWDNDNCSIVRVGTAPAAANLNNRDLNLCQLNANAIAFRVNNGLIGVRKTNTSTQTRTSNLFANAAPDVMALVSGSSGVVAYRGSKASTSMTALTGVTPAAGIDVGRFTTGTAANSDHGELWELACYQRQLDATSIAELNTYYATTYGFATQRTRLIFALGASTCFGTSGTYKRGWARRFSASFLNNTLICNHGSGGTTLGQQYAALSTIFDPLYVSNGLVDQGLPSNGNRYAVLLINFANDFALRGGESTEQDIEDRLISEYNDTVTAIRLADAGMRIIAFKPLEVAAMTTTYPTAYANYLAFLDSSADWDALIDLGDIAVDGSGHANDTGQQTIADRIESTISQFEARRGGGMLGGGALVGFGGL